MGYNISTSQQDSSARRSTVVRCLTKHEGTIFMLAIPNSTHSLRTCKRCGTQYPETSEFFYAHRESRGGLRAVCKKCELAHYERRRRESGALPPRRFSFERETELRFVSEMIEGHETVRSIASREGCCPSTIKKILHKYTTPEQRRIAKVRKQSRSLRGFKVSKETKLKLSERFYGAGNPFFGKKHSAKSLETMAEKKRGVPMPFEARKAISAFYQGISIEEWEGFKSGENERARNTSEYSAWRTAVFERDNFTCRMCGKRGGRLHAHHIKTFSKNPELRYVVSNGVTLCAEPCHRMTIGHEAEFESRFLVWVLTFEVVKEKGAQS